VSVAGGLVRVRHGIATSFPLTENPISEGSRWTNGLATGLDWKNVKTTTNFAFGTNLWDGSHYDDSTAILTGTWNKNQRCGAVIRTVNQNGSMNQEVELRLRSTVTANVNSGYEVLVKCTHDGTQYTDIVRWNGAIGSFTSLAFLNNTGFSRGVFDGDNFMAEMIGSTINVYLQGTLINTVTDTTFTTGNPGMGFWLNLNGQSGDVNTNADFGFSNFWAQNAT
jgi:hypothetical protein